MKKIALLALCTFVFTCYSCNNNASQSEQTEEETEEHADHQHEADEEDAIELNNGEKWKINEEMKPFVIQGEALVEKYMQGNDTDFKKLAISLEEQNDKFISSCRMDGKSHDELHKWLHPHLELVEELKEESDTAEATALVHRIHASYALFHSYFQ